MKNLAKIFCLLFVSHVCIGQQNSSKELSPQYTVPIKKEIKEEPIIYRVHEASFEKTTVAEVVPILNEDYARLERNIRIFEKDSIYYNNILQAAIEKQNDLLKMRTMINEFIVSSENFDDKKEKLISAQKLADKYNLSELIYADNAINSKNSTDFLILRIDDEFLNRHLKRVIWHIQDLFVALPSTNAKVINKNLQNLRLALKGTEKYRYSTGKNKSIIRDGMVISDKFDNSEFFKDNFEQLGPHFIVYNEFEDKFQKGELIDKNTALKNNLISVSNSGGSWELFKQKNTGRLYLVDFNFVDEEALYTHEKFNNGELPVNSFRQSGIVFNE